ncbi:hypothetical protein LTR84_006584 [Exophiala bonariae]|uniref:DUF6604 domain-containing protein n=1 Tax=Exophiala bonariae TaxID=1690606 RepID=A0AAV9N0G5_9EURO|nr:hypothetical protein LTR84_006584 [Exophiala bonariae]
MKMAGHTISQRSSWASLNTSDSENSGSDNDLEYKKCYGTSKRASRNVQSWLEREALWAPKTSKVSDLEGIAKTLVKTNVQMPDNILDDLKKTIECRKELNDIHKSRGNGDQSHIFALNAYRKVFKAFCPISPPPSPPQMPAVVSGNQSYALRLLDSKPKYTKKDPMWE